MTPHEYLEAVLADQTLADDSDEMKTLRERRDHVETVLRNAFSGSNPTIRYGGSIIKGTLNREAYDLDIICYFESGDTGAGETLEDIFNNTGAALTGDYYVDPKSSALRLKSRDPLQFGVDFHIDVVPGRFTDGKREDAYLYRSTGEKCRLKTNLQKHIDHVKESGRVEEIRLAKLWKVRYGLDVRNFALELLVIEALKGTSLNAGLDERLRNLWVRLTDNMDDLRIEDPANPAGNDLSELLNETIRRSLSYAASVALETVRDSGWGAVFGEIDRMTEAEKSTAVRAAAAAVSNPARPWRKN